MRCEWIEELARALSSPRPSNIVIYPARVGDEPEAVREERIQEAIRGHFAGWPLPEVVFILPEKEPAPEPGLPAS